MSETEPTEAEWKKMQFLVKTRLHAKYDSMSDRMKNLPTIHFQDPQTLESVLLSPKDAINEVEALTDIGKHIIKGTIALLQELQP